LQEALLLISAQRRAGPAQTHRDMMLELHAETGRHKLGKLNAIGVPVGPATFGRDAHWACATRDAALVQVGKSSGVLAQLQLV